MMESAIKFNYYKKGWDNPVDKDKFLDSINKTKQTTCQKQQQH